MDAYSYGLLILSSMYVTICLIGLHRQDWESFSVRTEYPSVILWSIAVFLMVFWGITLVIHFH